MPNRGAAKRWTLAVGRVVYVRISEGSYAATKDNQDHDHTQSQPAPPGGAIIPILISVDEDPLDLVGVDEGNNVDNPNAHINWKISTTTGWKFAPNGIAIDRAQGKFTDKGHPGGDKNHHRWQREKKEVVTDPDHKHKYTITVTDGKTAVSWDPWVVNRWVFTLPAPIAAIAYYNKTVIYDLLFEVATETLRTIATDPKHLGAQIGVTLVLHTWGSALTHHPHVHGIVPGGGLAPDGKRWVACKPGFFLPVRVLSRLFRRRFLEQLDEAHRSGQLQFFGEFVGLADARAFAAWLAPLRACEWVVYAKRPFAGPAAVLAYLSRYTHRVAISNQRLLALDERGVSFRWKDYRATGRTRHKTMTLATDEFIRRFLLHVLPVPPHSPLRAARQCRTPRASRPRARTAAGRSRRGRTATG